MDMKQKSLFVLTVAALGFLGYQVFQLVDRDITETPVLAQQTATSQATQTTEATQTTQTTQTAQAMPLKSVVQPMVVVQQQAPVQAYAVKLLHQASPTQHAYMQMLNQYELVKMRHQLLDEEAAVAHAQQTIVTTQSKTRKIAGADGDLSAGLDAEAAGGFVLSYLDKQSGRWSATLHHAGIYQSVHVGDALPGSFQVVAIDRKGVTLQKQRQREVISFNGTVQLPTLPASVIRPTQTALRTAHAVKTSTQPLIVHGELQTQAQLLQLQLDHHGIESKGIARDGLVNTIGQPALVMGKVQALRLDQRRKLKAARQLSIHDRFADESEDTMEDAGNLPSVLHLRAMQIMPHINQAYSTASYLPQQTSVPVTYQLAQLDTSVEQQYSQESADSEMPQHHQLSTDEKRLLKLPQQYYTIQLIGSNHADVVHQFVMDHELRRAALELSIGRPKHPWSIALYGIYRSFDSAESRLVHLPENMRQNGAWIRKVGDVQKVLRTRA